MGKQIVNATTIVYNNIQFKSKLEMTCYKELLVAGFSPQYEAKQLQVLEEFTLENGYYYIPKLVKRKPRRKKLWVFTHNISSINYTPDFFLTINKVKIFIETKGRANEAYPLRKKLFLLYLENYAKLHNTVYCFFEVHNKDEIMQMIKILKSMTMKKQLKNIRNLISNLPPKDRPVAMTLFNSYQIDDLQDLVDSAILKTERLQKQKEKCPPEYANLDINKLLTLKAELDCYVLQLELADPSEDN